MPEGIQIVIKEDDVSTMQLTSVTNAITVCSHTLPLLSNSLPFSLHARTLLLLYTRKPFYSYFIMCCKNITFLYFKLRFLFETL